MEIPLTNEQVNQADEQYDKERKEANEKVFEFLKNHASDDDIKTVVSFLIYHGTEYNCSIFDNPFFKDVVYIQEWLASI